MYHNRTRYRGPVLFFFNPNGRDERSFVEFFPNKNCVVVVWVEQIELLDYFFIGKLFGT